jgi:hypothetical protein
VPGESDWVLGNERVRARRRFEVDGHTAEAVAHWRVGTRPPAAKLDVWDDGDGILVGLPGPTPALAADGADVAKAEADSVVLHPQRPLEVLNMF